MSKKKQRRYRRDDIVKVSTKKGVVALKSGQHFWECGQDIEVREYTPKGSRLVLRIEHNAIIHVEMEA
jgi:hypothetical protein